MDIIKKMYEFSYIKEQIKLYSLNKYFYENIKIFELSYHRKNNKMHFTEFLVKIEIQSARISLKKTQLINGKQIYQKPSKYKLFG